MGVPYPACKGHRCGRLITCASASGGLAGHHCPREVQRVPREGEHYIATRAQGSQGAV
jgi:hypothetical protein